MNEPSPQPSSQPRPRIVDVVFGAHSPPPSYALLIGVLLSLLLHGLVFAFALRSETSLEEWSAALSARVHAELSREQFVELTPPSPPPTPPAEPPPTPASPKTSTPRAPKPVAKRSTPPPPAQAGNIVAREPRAEEPADLTGQTFVTGTATAYAGGVTTATGTNPTAVQSREVNPKAPPGEPDRSSPVSLEDPDWRCPWPREAEAEQIDEETAIVRVMVRSDGSVESVNIVRDPGHGFGQAAVACAMATRFVPAHDRQGRPLRSLSPPVRVRFTR